MSFASSHTAKKKGNRLFFRGGQFQCGLAKKTHFYVAGPHVDWPKKPTFKWGHLAFRSTCPPHTAMVRRCTPRAEPDEDEVQADNNNVPADNALVPHATSQHNNTPPNSNSPHTTNNTTHHWNMVVALLNNFELLATDIYTKTMAVHKVVEKLKLYLQGNYASYADFIKHCKYLFCGVLCVYLLQVPLPPIPDIKKKNRIIRNTEGYAVCIVL